MADLCNIVTIGEGGGGGGGCAGDTSAEKTDMSELKPARARATKLLLSYLDDEQKQTFLTRGYFKVVGCHTGKTYLLNRDAPSRFIQHGSIHYGAYVMGDAIREDSMLAVKLYLETDENYLLKVACAMDMGMCIFKQEFTNPIPISPYPVNRPTPDMGAMMVFAGIIGMALAMLLLWLI